MSGTIVQIQYSIPHQENLERHRERLPTKSKGGYVVSWLKEENHREGRSRLQEQCRKICCLWIIIKQNFTLR
jgi:hypothetical protein